MLMNNNIWEIAEAWHAGALADAEKEELKNRMALDPEFGRELQECIDLVSSLDMSGKRKRFKASLAVIRKEGRRKPVLVSLPAHFWRTAAVAAGVALLTSTLTYTLLNQASRKSDNQYNRISREVAVIRQSQNQLNQSQKELEKDIRKLNPAPAAHVRYTGTGFALNNDGFFVTSYHVIDGADSIYIQDKNGNYFKAVRLASDPVADLAVLRVARKNFHFSKSEVPYTFATTKAGLGAGIFTLGYPKNDLVYSTGAISCRTGYDGNDQQYTLELPVGHGQSGSPLFDSRGNVIGILTAMGGEAEANTYAVNSRALLALIDDKLDGDVRLPKASRLQHLDREEQIEKLESFTFSVKVYKK